MNENTTSHNAKSCSYNIKILFIVLHKYPSFPIFAPRHRRCPSLLFTFFCPVPSTVRQRQSLMLTPSQPLCASSRMVLLHSHECWPSCHLNFLCNVISGISLKINISHMAFHFRRYRNDLSRARLKCSLRPTAQPQAAA